MALAAMAGTFSQIAPCQNLLGCSVGQGDNRLGAQVEPLPQADATADVEGKAQRIIRRLAGDCRERLHEGIEIGDVLRLHPRIRGVGEGRIEMLAGGRYALHHGIGEILHRPRADAVPGVLRDIGRHEGAERRLELKAASQFEARLALCARPGMAGRAAAGKEDALSLGGVAGGEFRQGIGIKPDRRRQGPAGDRADATQHDGGADELLQPGHARVQPFLILKF